MCNGGESAGSRPSIPGARLKPLCGTSSVTLRGLDLGRTRVIFSEEERLYICLPQAPLKIEIKKYLIYYQSIYLRNENENNDYRPISILRQFYKINLYSNRRGGFLSSSIVCYRLDGFFYV
jgi:hypothetical protein